MKLLQIYKSLGKDFLNFIFPPLCIICEKVNVSELICKKCRLKLKEQNHECHVCKRSCDNFIHEECAEFTNLAGVFVPFKYSKMIELIVQDLKYHFHSQTAELIVNLILTSIQGEIFEDFLINTKDKFVLIPVPLYKDKKNLRGFNQAELIANAIYKTLVNNSRFLTYHKTNDLHVANILKRIRNTKTQVGMNRQERIENLKDVFEVDANVFNSLLWEAVERSEAEEVSESQIKFILIDDIYTTGTTMEECAKALKSNFPNSKIYGLVFARG